MKPRRDLAELVANAASTVLKLPPGRFVLEAPLVIDRPLTIRGPRATIVGSKGTAVIVVGNKARLVLEKVSVVRQGKTPGHVIRCRSGELTLTSCVVRGGKSGRAGSHVGAGVALEGSARATIDRCSFLANELVAVFVTAKSRLVAKRSSCEGGIAGFYVSGRGHAELEGNRITRAIGGGISFDGHSTGTARKNRLTKCGHAILAVVGSAPLLEGNVCIGSKDDGIWVAGRATPTITKNLVEGGLRTGIHLEGQSRTTLRANRVRTSAWDGVKVMDRAEVDAQGNVIEKSARSGFAIESRAPGRWTKNRATRNGRHGILVTGRARPTLVSNVLTANAGAGIAYAKGGAATAKNNVCRKNGSDAS
jgi:parallel beta-helix repeat protein